MKVFLDESVFFAIWMKMYLTFGLPTPPSGPYPFGPPPKTKNWPSAKFGQQKLAKFRPNNGRDRKKRPETTPQRREKRQGRPPRGKNATFLASSHPSRAHTQSGPNRSSQSRCFKTDLSLGLTWSSPLKLKTGPESVRPESVGPFQGFRVSGFSVQGSGF